MPFFFKSCIIYWISVIVFRLLYSYFHHQYLYIKLWDFNCPIYSFCVTHFRYRTIKDSIGKFGAGKACWVYFDKINAILHKDIVTQPASISSSCKNFNTCIILYTDIVNRMIGKPECKFLPFILSNTLYMCIITFK